MSARGELQAAMEAQKAGRLSEAEAAYRSVLRQQPRDVEALMLLGVLLQNKPDLAGACATFATATEVVPHVALAWLSLGGCLWRLDRADEAVSALSRASNLDPRYEVAYSLRALILNRQGRFAEAAEVYREWHAHHPANPIAKHMLAATSGAGAPPRASPEYIRFHFDRLAADFDQHLLALGYRGPQIAAGYLRARAGSGALLDIVDAGCGTGLGGPALRPLARRLVGVDLSPQMLDRARGRGTYDELIVQDLSEFMCARPGMFDAVVCVDTFNYFGELDQPLRAARHCLRRGGLVAFTAESLDEDGAPYRLEQHGRYRHSIAYIRSTVAGAGFADLSIESHALRRERGVDVMCYVVLAEVS